MGLLQVRGVFGVFLGPCGCVHRASIARDEEERRCARSGSKGVSDGMVLFGGGVLIPESGAHLCPYHPQKFHG